MIHDEKKRLCDTHRCPCLRHTQMVKMPAVAWFCDVLSSVELSTAIKECAEMQRNGGYDVSLLATCNFVQICVVWGSAYPRWEAAPQNMMGSFSQTLRNWVFAFAQFALGFLRAQRSKHSNRLFGIFLVRTRFSFQCDIRHVQTSLWDS